MRSRILLAAIAFALLTCTLSAQSALKVPFEIDLSTGRIYVSAIVEVEGGESSEAEWFLFDTGFTGMHVLFLTKAARRLNIPYDDSEIKKFKQANYGIKGFYPINQQVSISLGGARFRTSETGVILFEDDRPIFAVLKGRLVKVAGIIGLDFFKGRFIQISYDEREITVSDERVPLSGWLDVSAAESPDDDLLVKVHIGEEQIAAPLDSGGSGVAYLSRATVQKYSPDTATDDDFVFESSNRFPEMRLGDKPLSVQLIRTGKKAHIDLEHFPAVLGPLAMLQFNWIIEVDKRKAYIQPRRTSPRIYQYAFPFTPLWFEFRGEGAVFSAVSLECTRFRKAGITEECIVLQINGVDVRDVVEYTRDENLINQILFRLAANPFTNTARFKLRCKDAEREVSVRLLEAHKVLDLFHLIHEKIPRSEGSEVRGRVDFSLECSETEKDRITLRLSGHGDVNPFYKVNGERIILSDATLKVVRVFDVLAIELSIEDLLELMYDALAQDKPFRLLCQDESGREVLIEFDIDPTVLEVASPAPKEPPSPDTSGKP